MASQSPIDERLSIDSDRPPLPSPNGVNGHAVEDDDDADPLSRLQHELERTRAEKETLAIQYRTLLAKLTTMRTTLGNKLKQDAEELDRREQLLTQLQLRNDDLEGTVETLKDELLVSNSDAERATAELHELRATALQDSSHETLLRERELKETQTELERCRLEKEDWERTALEAKASLDEQRVALDEAERNLQMEREARERDAYSLASERDRADNLQSVLADFQGAKDHELRQSLKDYETQLHTVTQSLAEYKMRALNAEVCRRCSFSPSY